MAFPTSAGILSNSGTLIPEVWSAKIIANLYAASVVPAISNVDYEGDIRQLGDTVHIRRDPVIQIRDYRKGDKLIYDDPETNITDLLIDKGKAWSFKDHDTDKAQANYKYQSRWTQAAADNMRVHIDTLVLADVYADAHADNKGSAAGAISSSYNMGVSGTPLQVTKTNVLDILIDASSVLKEQNADSMDRWVVIPTWMAGMIKKSDLKDTSLTGDDISPLRNGKIGKIDEMDIYSSNLLSTVTDGGNLCFNAMFGHKSALTFATQLIENEGPMRSPEFFGDLYRGLQVFGYKVVRPEVLGHLYIYK